MNVERKSPNARPGVLIAGVLCGVVVAGAFAADYGRALGAPAQQARPAVPDSPPTGTATLTVQVVAGDSGIPIRGARLSILGNMLPPAMTQTPGAPTPAAGGAPRAAGATPTRDGAAAPPRVQKEGRTDQAGMATFTALPAGVYSINVVPPAAYVRTGSSSPVQIADGAAGKAVVRLDRGAVITGRVFDEYGEPVTGAFVQVFRKDSIAGASRVSGSSSSQPTNDLGQFRVWGLADGDYVVGATANDYAIVPGDSGVREGHLPTFYPGVAVYDGARAVAVKAGQETGGIEFAIVEGRLGTVSGRATDSAGNPLGAAAGMGANVSLAPKTVNPALGGRGASVRPDGSFIIPSVPPGDYNLSAALSGGTRSGAPREGAYVPVSVSGDEVTVHIQTNLGATVSGHVVIEGTAPAAPAGTPGAESRPSATRVSIQSASGLGFSPAFAAPPSAAVRPDGTFAVSGVRGPVHITAMAGRAALKTVRHGGRDISGQPLELLGTERIDDIVIVMTQETGRIEGVVNSDDGEAVAGAAVLVFPDDPDRWSTGSPFVRQTRTAGSGTRGGGQAMPGGSAPGATARTPLEPGAFTATMLPAGRYVVIAFPAGTSYLTPDRESLTRWRESAKVVTVETGQTATVTLTPIK